MNLLEAGSDFEIGAAVKSGSDLAGCDAEIISGRIGVTGAHVNIRPPDFVVIRLQRTGRRQRRAMA